MGWNRAPTYCDKYVYHVYGQRSDTCVVVDIAHRS